MKEYVLPGLIDPHVHLRDFGHAHKETFETGTAAAVAGGFVAVLDMPNNFPPDKRPYTQQRMVGKYVRAMGHSHIDVGMYAASQPEDDNVGGLEALYPLSVGIKFYIEQTTGNDTSLTVQSFMPAARRWHELAKPTQPIVAHVEDENVEEAIALFAGEIGHPFHIPHANTRFMLEAATKAKQQGLLVSVGVTPEHLFMTDAEVNYMGWRARMKPPLSSLEDQEYLWANLDMIDVFETDHAPHTEQEKNIADQENPAADPNNPVKCYGTPTLEAALPLLFTAVREGRLTPKQLIDKTSTQPARIFGLRLHPGSSVKIRDESYEFGAQNVKSKCGWSPFIGRVMLGRVVQTDLRGVTIYREGKLVNGGFLGDVIVPGTNTNLI